ncbi:hypothetical protein L228DRAFT_259587 [Xylona heveae TC161]|uniref:Uncharacterized protein n=1 Tax=Xylona heveae (strain CBS 132557 / TC161) TaxID=1328760 RepID=A0A161TEI9_XYLHT|nr:hypothetical protein L228DRAFT_259587 [Xylona heveae TC161]KZF24357.1 hypothetical protein L228DRAFT_259587 [Xylona heveae TC161]
MFARPAAYRQAVQQKFVSPPDYVWIGDELLNNVLHRFVGIGCSCRKRYSSNVPGPMEARRRLARRRIANIAVAIGSSPVDCPPILGMTELSGRQGWKWEAPSLPSARPVPATLEKQSPLPSWLTDYSPPVIEPTAKPRKPILRGLGSAIRSGAPQQRNEILLRFKGRLIPDMRIEELRRNMHQIDFAERQNPAYSRSICENFLLTARSHEELEEFLGDHYLNNPAACNLVRIVSSLNQKSSDPGTFTFILRMAKQALVQGHMMEKEVRVLWREIPEHVRTGPTELVEFYQSLWESIATSPVLLPHDLSSQTFDTMLVQLSKLPISSLSTSLAKSIIGSASKKQLRGIEMGISSFMSAWAKQFATNAQQQTSSIPDMSDFLITLQSCLSESIISATTRALKSSTRGFEEQKTDSSAALFSWLATLQHISGDRDVFLPDYCALLGKVLDADNFKSIAPHLSSANERQICTFLLSYWSKSKSWKYSPSTAHILDDFANLPPSFPKDQIYFHLISTLHKHKRLSTDTLRDLFRIFRLLKQPDALRRTVQLLAQSEISIDPKSIGAEIRYWSKSHPRIALDLFHLHWSLQLEGCKDLAIALVHLPSFPATKIFKLLHRNPSHQQTSLFSSSTSSLSASPKSYPHSSLSPTPTPTLPSLSKSRIALLHSLATAFAHAPHLTPRVALRNILRCYTYLHRHGAGMTHEMSRALAHAGITRALQEGNHVGMEKVRWILQKVRDLEGQEVADKLDHAVWVWRGKCIWERSKFRRRTGFGFSGEGNWPGEEEVLGSKPS